MRLGDRAATPLARLNSVEIDGGARMTWMRQPHYYLGLYPYIHSVGLVAATAMAGRVEFLPQVA